MLIAATMLEHDPELPARLRDELTMIRRNAELEARLIDDMLDLTRISRGKLTLTRDVVDAHELIRNVLGICCDQTEAKQLHVALELQASLHYVSGDAARLQQILWNLLKNAAKFTPPRGRIAIRTWNQNSAQGPAATGQGDRPPDSGNPTPGTLVIEITDTGVGIDPPLLPHIFNAFEQGSLGKQFGGLGLGLAISRALAELHGGSLAAASAGLGHGATFTLTLGAVPRPPVLADHHPKPHPAAAAGVRILLVEDHPDTARVTANLLRRLGYQCLTAGTRAAALELVAREPLDLVISDIGLPDGDGYQLLRELRAIHPIPAIALTGYGMEDDLRKATDAGFVAHLTKPIHIQTLESLIERLALRRP